MKSALQLGGSCIEGNEAETVIGWRASIMAILPLAGFTYLGFNFTWLIGVSLSPSLSSLNTCVQIYTFAYHVIEESCLLYLLFSIRPNPVNPAVGYSSRQSVAFHLFMVGIDEPNVLYDYYVT